MTRLSQLALSGWLCAATACSPACTPEAQSPESKAGDGATAASADAKSPQKQASPPIPAGDMIMEAKGVDLSKLSDAQRTTFFQLLNSEPSACDKPHSLAKSLKEDDKCRDSLIASQFIADRLAAGASAADTKELLEQVIDALQPQDIPTKGRPVWGNERAPVTIVVFADFQCPHCKAEVPVLRKAVDQFRGRVKLVFKHFPLSLHPRAKAAAIATEAALEQGKFWEMHDTVFAHPDDLTDEDLVKYAQQVGLDMSKFNAHYGAQKGKAAVEKDRADGERLDIAGTPAVYINGRLMHDMLFGGHINGWIDDALKR